MSRGIHASTLSARTIAVARGGTQHPRHRQQGKGGARGDSQIRLQITMGREAPRLLRVATRTSLVTPPPSGESCPRCPCTACPCCGTPRARRNRCLRPVGIGGGVIRDVIPCTASVVCGARLDEKKSPKIRGSRARTGRSRDGEGSRRIRGRGGGAQRTFSPTRAPAMTTPT